MSDERAIRPNPGMSVITHDQVEIGTVKEVRATDFLLDRSMRRDVFVPFHAIDAVTAHSVMLTVTADEVDDQEWEKPSLVGSEEDADSLAPREDRVVGTGDPAERNAWSASSDAYSLEPLDTTEQRLATQGTDDGVPPRDAEPPTDDELNRRLPRTDERSG